MPEEVVQNPEAPVETPVQPDINVQLAQAMWTGASADQPSPTAEPPAPAAVATPPVAAEPPKEEYDYVSPEEWLKKEFNFESIQAAKEKIESWQKMGDTPPTPQEIKFANEQSQKYFDAITNGKTDDLYSILHQQKQIERLEKLPIANTNEAAEIIKASYQFKHGNLTADEINFLVDNKYKLPAKPQRTIGQEDSDYQLDIQEWQQQVQNIEKQMIIDAKLAQPDVAKYKSELVLPDIPKINAEPQPDQKALEARQAFHQNFMQRLNSDYQNFKGYSVMAKDGEVELPISYNISADELAQSRQQLENFNVNEFLDQRWFDANGNPNINVMQADLYDMMNRDKVHQKIANEAAAQMRAHMIKSQNNIKLNGVTTPTAPVSPVDTKAEQQQLAEFVWKM